MKNTPELKSNIYKVSVITVAYVIFSWLLFLYSHTFLTSTWSLGIVENYNVWYYLLSNTLIGIIAGVFGGMMMVYVNGSLFRKKSFRFAMLTTLTGYSSIFIFISIVVPSFMILLKVNVFGDMTMTFTEILASILSLMALSNYLLWGMVVLLTLFFLQINDKFGPGILLKFLMGKYYHPKEEDRIFIFMDMKSSTTIAESIGNARYFEMLQDVFNDITDPIISCEGEIYQYVGDEIIVSWNLKEGIKNENFIRCFTQVRDKLNEIAPRYKEKYGFTPEFKAGVHHGTVTAGEIGSIKKDIVYSGDVLNTTSRIQEQCNEYKVNFLVSQQTMSLLKDNGGYGSTSLGEIELRGKNERISLLSLKF